MNQATDVDELLRLADSLFAEMHKVSGEWDELRRRILPRYDDKARMRETPTRVKSSAVRDFSPVAYKALLNLASAHLLFITPIDQQWFALRPTEEDGDYDRGDDWYAEATEAVYRALADSNFYAVAHEVYLDRCLTGTGCMFADVTKDRRLVFTHVPTGTYAIAEGAHGEVNTLVRLLKLTAAQAVEYFGGESLPEKIRRVYENRGDRYTELFEFVHVVVPNESAEYGSDMVPPMRRKWRDVYIARDSRQIVSEGGFYEFPFLVTRFLRGGVSPYGEAPGRVVLPEIESSLLMDRVMDVAGSRIAMPSVLITASMAKQVDLRAGGRTIVPEDAYGTGFPKTWADVGDVRFLLERQENKHRVIREAFFNDVLQVVSQVERQMTATEVNARESERIICFFSSFIQFASDFQGMMRRIVCLMWRNRDSHNGAKLPEHAPEEFFSYSADGTKYELNVPAARYVGKIAQAFDRIQRYGLEGVLDSIGKLVQLTGDSSIMARLKPWHIMRFLWDSSGAPRKCLVSAEENEELEQAAREQAQQAQQAALLEQLSKAGKDQAMANNLNEAQV